MHYLVDFGKFWYDFVIGDDWAIALAVAAALVVLLVVHHAIAPHSHPADWWLLPLVVVLILGFSLRRATQ